MIHIKGARTHNLKNIEVKIPKNKITVVTGLSGSGKSSLAFDTLYAEGQRRYVESLSSYVRQFLGRLEKPPVDFIKGISPAIAIEQKVISRNPRSTVGTTTEIYDYLKLMFARVGKTFDPVSGVQVKRHTIQDIVDLALQLPDEETITILAPVTLPENRTWVKQLELLSLQGFSRVSVNNVVVRISEVKETETKKWKEVFLVIDRVITNKSDEDNATRLADSAQIAFQEGSGNCILQVDVNVLKKNKIKHEGFNTGLLLFNNRFESNGVTFEEPDVNFFTFNNPIGACKKCEGFGSIIGISDELVIPNKNISIYDDAVVCWKGEVMSEWKNDFIRQSHKIDFPIHTPIAQLTKAQYKILWEGKGNIAGINAFFEHIESQTYKIQYRVMLARYRGKTACPDCHGTRLRKDAEHVLIDGKNIMELVLLPIEKLQVFFKNIKLSDHDAQIAKRLLIEINTRLQYMMDVGLGYLTLNRVANTLSGGESQRISLSTSLGSSLVGSMYILDEPSIGLHPRDTHNLIKVLKSLRNQGNTVIVVEHDEEIMRESDYIIDIGPEAGTLGGNVVFEGDLKDIKKEKKSLTARYLNKLESIEKPTARRQWTKYIEVKNASINNLKNLDVKFPLNTLTVVTGVSGSGKSSLVKGVLVPAMERVVGGMTDLSGTLDGHYKSIAQTEFVDQNPIGKSSRSNPVTYVKAYDEIRTLYADQGLSKARGYKPSHFSFNVEGGRCETCQGEGIVTVEMQFMANLELTCESCHGKRFKQEVCEITFQDKSITDLLEMTVDDAMTFFSTYADKNNACRKIVARLKPLQDVGLGYVHLGQSSSTLSGGEAQRIKLASFLIGGNNFNHTLFVFDEPTTGLHFHDIKKLMDSFNALLYKGHSIIVIEHNVEVMKCADWIIDIGPEAGERGGELVFAGTPEDLLKCKKSHTAKYLSL